MKTIRFKHLLRATFGVVLLAAAVPFAAFAQSDAPKEVTLTLEGTFDGQDNFDFEENTIRLRHMSFQMPTGVTVDGKPWADLNKPFELDLAPDFAKAAIVEKQGRGAVDLIVNPDNFTLVIDDMEASSAPYKVTIAVKNQGIHEPVPSFVRSKPSPMSQPDQRSVRRRTDRRFRPSPKSPSVQLVEPSRRGGIQKIFGRIYPQEFDARMQELEKSMSEKGRRTSLMMRCITNPSSMTDEQKKEAQQWANEGDPLKMMYEKTTDGKEIPARSGGGLGPGDLLNRSLTHRTIEIEAVIDFAADFEIHETMIKYNFSDGAVEGKFPREVKINGEPWPNLFVPFDLGMTVDPLSVSDAWIETEFYQYTITPRQTKVCVGIRNRGIQEEPVKIKVSLKRN
ncbi:MAG: hypothetical protein IJT68_06200 [Lentisphaeria bacterium]|nr:hypothetical protein [Lentisphaeria bacterium]